MKIIKASDGQEILVDVCDFDLLNRHKWFVQDNGYAYSPMGKSKNIDMHNMVFGTREPGKVIDHINRNRLDNRRENLRQVSVWHNTVNRSKMKAADRKYNSPYIGVFHKHEGNTTTYEAGISVKGRYFYAGRFKTEIEASYQRDAIAYKIHEHLAVLNHPDKLEEYKNWVFDNKIMARFEKLELS